MVAPLWDASPDFAHPIGPILRALADRVLSVVCSQTGKTPPAACRPATHTDPAKHDRKRLNTWAHYGVTDFDQPHTPPQP